MTECFTYIRTLRWHSRQASYSPAVVTCFVFDVVTVAVATANGRSARRRDGLWRLLGLTSNTSAMLHLPSGDGVASAAKLEVRFDNSKDVMGQEAVNGQTQYVAGAVPRMDCSTDQHGVFPSFRKWKAGRRGRVL